jgi:hypothetical protein
LQKLKTILERGLEKTASLWEDIRIAYRWVHKAARILDNEDAEDSAQVRRQYQGMLGAMQRWSTKTGALHSGIQHFLKVTRSYWPGLFHCYEIDGLPRTNNDLEHVFGSHRYHERRITGRKVGSSAMVIRGATRVVAAAVTQLRTFSDVNLAMVDLSDWTALRQELDKRRHGRRMQRRFRRDPDTYLANLEELLSS